MAVADTKGCVNNSFYHIALKLKLKLEGKLHYNDTRHKMRVVKRETPYYFVRGDEIEKMD